MASRAHDRGTHAPMDFTWQHERDPGVFSLPAKRQHIETEGRSSWAPAPYAVFGNAPLLFDTSSAMQVDEEPARELVDVDMVNVDSPAKQPSGHQERAREHESAAGPSLAELGASLPAPASSSTTDSSQNQPLASGSVAHRTMNTTAVRKVQKARQKAGSALTGGSGSAGTSAPGKENEDRAVVLRDGEGELSDGLSEGEGHTTARLRRRTNASTPSRSHLGAASASAPSGSVSDGPRYSTHMGGNSYTLNVFGQHPDKSGDGASGTDRLEPKRIGVSHSDMPYIALGYVQFVFNAAIVCFCIYLGGIFIWTIRQDIKERARAQESELLAEIFNCNYLFGLNKCEPHTRIPAMESQCIEWELCGQRDPKAVGRAKVGAEMFAGVISGFVDELSWKTIFFLLFSLTCLVFIANSALFSMRARHVAQYHPGVYAPYPPPLAHHTHGLDPQIQQHRFEWPPALASGGTLGNDGSAQPGQQKGDRGGQRGQAGQGLLRKLGLS